MKSILMTAERVVLDRPISHVYDYVRMQERRDVCWLLKGKLESKLNIAEQNMNSSTLFTSKRRTMRWRKMSAIICNTAVPVMLLDSKSTHTHVEWFTTEIMLALLAIVMLRACGHCQWAWPGFQLCPKFSLKAIVIQQNTAILKYCTNRLQTVYPIAIV